jgi:hypothetical protein
MRPALEQGEVTNTPHAARRSPPTKGVPTHMRKQINGTRSKKSSSRRLSRERCRALEVLVRSGHLGATEATLMAYGFSTAMLAAMACDGFITVVVDTVRAGDRTMNVRRLRITDAGREMIGGPLWQHRMKP